MMFLVMKFGVLMCVLVLLEVFIVLLELLEDVVLRL